MISDIKWGHNDENALYWGAKGVFSAFLTNIHLRILDRLERGENLDVRCNFSCKTYPHAY